MGYSADLLNKVRAVASDEYKARIPVATQTNISTIGNALQTYTVLFNEFCEALINRIGKTILDQLLFENDLAEFKMGEILSQQDVQEIFVEMAKAEGAYNPAGPNPLGRRDASEVFAIYHRQNRQDAYCISIGDIDFVRNFASEATLEEFIKSQIQSVYSGAEYDEWLAMKELMASYDGYFDYQVPELDGTNNESACRALVKTVRKAVNDLSFVSKKYNKAGVMTRTKRKNLVLFVHKDVIAEVDVEVLAKAFNMGKTNFEPTIKVMDDFGSLENTYAILADKKWFRVFDTLRKMEPQRNAQGLFTNYFYHVHQILSLSHFKNAVRFTTDAVE